MTLYARGQISAKDALATVNSYSTHLKQGHTGRLRYLAFRSFVLKRNEHDKEENGKAG